MEKRLVLLIRIQPLFAEGIELVLHKLEDVELISLDCVNVPELDACLKDIHPAMILLAGEKEDDRAMHLISYLLNHFENVPVVWAELETNHMRFYTSHSLNATSSELLSAIREEQTRLNKTP